MADKQPLPQIKYVEVTVKVPVAYLGQFARTMQSFDEQVAYVESTKATRLTAEDISRKDAGKVQE
jgi:hypothetical protein